MSIRHTYVAGSGILVTRHNPAADGTQQFTSSFVAPLKVVFPVGRSSDIPGPATYANCRT
jgi:hypothetical protein